MKRVLLALALVTAFAMPILAQENDPQPQFQGVDGIAEKVHIANKKYIPYVYVREADVLWSKTIWRMIDLREKVNLPLYYPTREIDGRRSLMTVIYDALCNGDLRAYRADTDNEFSVMMDIAGIKKQLGASSDTIDQEDPATGRVTKVVLENEANLEEVKKILLKEVWYFDKKYTRMDVRIIGLCPVIERMNAEGTRLDQSMGFWIYFPELRPYLAQNEIFNTKNDSQRESLDDLFAQRMFGSYIFREANVYNNRSIIDYASGMESTMEAERIKQDLFVKEHDMWEF